MVRPAIGRVEGVQAGLHVLPGGLLRSRVQARQDLLVSSLNERSGCAMLLTRMSAWAAVATHASNVLTASRLGVQFMSRFSLRLCKA